MIKKLIGLAILVLLVIGGISYYVDFVYVPKGQTFSIKYLNVERLNVVGSPNEEKVELTNRGLYTRTNFTYGQEELYYKFDVTNDGTLDAKLKYKPLFLKTDMYFKDNISYKITYIDDGEVLEGDSLRVGETKTFKVTIKYHTSESPTQNSQFYESLVWLVYVRK